MIVTSHAAEGVARAEFTRIVSGDAAGLAV